jgi:hypothetical protein
MAEQGIRFLLKKRAAMNARTNVQPVSLCSWVAVTGNIYVTRALYRNIPAVNPAPKPARPRIMSLRDCYIKGSHSVSQNRERL